MNIGLIDGNNFFVSCEQVFQPKLLSKPVIVLSNTGGCVVARSPEAKSLGIAMGAPFFKIESLVKEHQVHVLSSNFELYQDMHHRLMRYLRSQLEDIHVYSIDEAFFTTGLSLEADRLALGKRLQESVLQRLGLPVSIGFGPTKTLAKGANYFSKKIKSTQGVVDLCDPSLRPLYLKNLPIAEVWGIGRQYAKFLESQKILDALSFCQQPPQWVDKHMTITGARIYQELWGIQSYAFIESPQPQKSLTVSRSFGHAIQDFNELKEAVCFFAGRAGEKLRQQNLWAREMTITLMTKERGEKGFLTFGAQGQFNEPTHLTKNLIQMAATLMTQSFRSGFSYRKAGVHFYDFYGPHQRQMNIFSTSPPVSMESPQGLKEQINLGDNGVTPNASREESNIATQGAMDALNKRFGRNSVFYGAQGLAPTWSHETSARSPRWTTRWSELPVVV